MKGGARTRKGGRGRWRGALDLSLSTITEGEQIYRMGSISLSRRKEFRREFYLYLPSVLYLLISFAFLSFTFFFFFVFTYFLCFYLKLTSLFSLLHLRRIMSPRFIFDLNI